MHIIQLAYLLYMYNIYYADPRDDGEQTWYGFKIVGDNVDKNVRPSLQRLDHHTQSLHYFHSFAVLDQVDLSSLSDAEPPIGEIDTACLLPSAADIAALKEDFVVLVSRYTMHHFDSTHFEFFSSYRVLLQHISTFTGQAKSVHVVAYSKYVWNWDGCKVRSG